MANHRCLLWPAIILPLCMMCAQLTGIVGQGNAVTCTFTNTLGAGDGLIIDCDSIVGQNYSESVQLGDGQSTQFLFYSFVSYIECFIRWPKGHFASFLDIVPANSQFVIKTDGIFRNGAKVRGWEVSYIDYPVNNSVTCTFTNSLGDKNGVYIDCDSIAGQNYSESVPLVPGQSTQFLFNSFVSHIDCFIRWPNGHFTSLFDIAPADAQFVIKNDGIFGSGTKVGRWEVDYIDYPVNNAVTCTFTNTLSAGNGVYIDCDSIAGQNYSESVPLGAGQSTQFLFDSFVSVISCAIGWPKGHFNSSLDIAPANA